MTLTLQSIRHNAAPKPPKVVVYGVPGIGKTTFASRAPNPIFVLAEDGLGHLDVPSFPRATGYQDILDAIAVLQRGPHDFGTFVLDGLDAVEPMLWQHVANKAGKANIEDFGYGKGLSLFAPAEWTRLLGLLDDLRDRRGMCIVLLAHSKVSEFRDPTLAPYDRYTMRLHDRAESLVRGWTDNLLFAHYETRTVQSGRDEQRRIGVSTGRRLLETQERPGWNAKNRYSLPETIGLDWDEFLNGVTASFNKTEPAQPAEQSAAAQS